MGQTLAIRRDAPDSTDLPNVSAFLMELVVRFLLLFVSLGALLLHPADSSAQPPRERRGGFQRTVQAIRDTRIVVAADQPVIEKGTIVLVDGVITAVGADVEIPKGANVVDGTGLVVYPGFINALADISLPQERQPSPAAGRKLNLEQYALAATPPDNRRGLTPEFQLSTRLPWDENAQKGYREAGLTDVHAVYPAPIAAGLSCLVTTSGAPLRETLIDDALASTFLIAPPQRSGGEEQTRYPSTFMGSVAHLRQAFLDAARHARQRELFDGGKPAIARPFDDPAFDALGAVLRGESKGLFLARVARPERREEDDPGARAFGFLPSDTEVDRIHRALDFAAEQKLTPILSVGVGAVDAIERLKAEKPLLILELDLGEEPQDPKKKPEEETKEIRSDFPAPKRHRDYQKSEWSRKAAVAAALDKAGVPFALSTRGLKNPGDLLKTVRVLIEHGLPEEKAIASLTSNAAEVLGQREHLGELKAGRWGHVTVLSASPKEKHSKLRYVLVDGALFEFNAPEKGKEGKPDEKPSVQLDGRWELTIDQGNGKSASATLELSQSENALSGSFTSEQGAGRIEGGRVTGKTVRFTVEIGIGEKALRLQFTGEAAEKDGTTSLSGKLVPPFGPETTWSARSDKPKETAKSDAPASDDKKPGNPVALSIDDSGSDAATKTEKPAPEKSAAEKPEEKTAKNEKPKADRPKVADFDNYPTELPSDRFAPIEATGGNLFVRGGTVLVGTGDILENASILIREGKIAAIGSDLKPDDGMKVVDARGKWITPGLIDTHSHIMFDGGLSQVNEGTQSIVCEVRVRDVIATHDPAEYRALAGGLTTARLLHGSANCIGGQDAVVKLKVGSSLADHLVLDRPIGVKFALGENVKRNPDRFPHTRLGVEATLKRAFFEALDYRRTWIEYERAKKAAGDAGEDLLAPRRDLRLERLVAILNRETLIHSHCYRADEILMLLRTADSLGFRIQSLQHVLEGYKIAPEILKHGASCSTFADWWAYKVEAYDATPYNASLLTEAGVSTVIKSDNAELMRHLNFEAAKSLKYGNMPADAALRMVTINAARELGLDKKIGSLEVGKDGDLAIFTSHPFNTFSKCLTTVIEGEIRYQQAKQPTTMSAAAVKRSASPPKFAMADDEVRAKRLEIAESDSGVYAIENVTLHPVEGPDDVIEHGTLIIADGKIQALGRDVPAPEGATIVNATGLHAYPGLIDSGCLLGVHEIDALDVTQDSAENGPFQPDLYPSTAINVDSELLPVARAGGITAALIRPRSGIIAGQCSLILTAGWTAPEMTVREAVGLAVNWPTKSEEIASLKEFMKAARRYDEIRSAEKKGAEQTVVDPRYEAMRPYLKRAKPVFIEGHTRRQMAEALQWAEEEKLRVVLTGATDAWKLAPEISARKVPVILGPVIRAPLEPWDTFDAPYANPGRLFEAGVPIAIRSDEEANARNAPLEAGFAVGYGLPEKEALKAVTLGAARILGVANELGSLKAGKRANVLLTDGSPLQHTTQFKAIFVGGKPYAPESRQTRFYEKYRERIAK